MALLHACSTDLTSAVHALLHRYVNYCKHCKWHILQNAASGRPTSLNAALASDSSSSSERYASFTSAVAAHLVSLAPDGLFDDHNLTPAAEGNMPYVYTYIYIIFICVYVQDHTVSY
jgi:hypothetical protein